MVPEGADQVNSRMARAHLLAVEGEWCHPAKGCPHAMSFEPTSLLISFVFGSIGFVVFVYGRRMKRFPHMVADVLLMAYPLVVGDPLIMAAVGLTIVGLWAGAVRMGA